MNRRGVAALVVLVAMTLPGVQIGCNEKPVPLGRAPGPTADAAQPTQQAGPTAAPAQPAREVTSSGPNELKVGEEFIFRLQANHTTGYQWQLADPLDEKVLKLVGTEYKVPQTSPGLVGAGGIEVWAFKAVGQGTAKVAFKYVRSWEKDVLPAQINAFAVVVR